ncbi:MAG: hypothetical protein JKY65_20450 [Planctomycetes bacterium]|nr:hypothetical protein [Planctomycetota bacterium]
MRSVQVSLVVFTAVLVGCPSTPPPPDKSSEVADLRKEIADVGAKTRRREDAKTRRAA